MSSHRLCAPALNSDPDVEEPVAGMEPAGGEVRTFLIADLRGYTSFTHREGDEAAARVSEQFLALASGVIERHDGQVFNSAGDQILAAFASARQALKAALALQVRLAEEQRAHPTLPLHAGIGLDSGEAIRVGSDYRGGAINLAARLCALAGPDEVLASDGVVHLTRRMEGVRFTARGQTELKGFSDPVQVIGVTVDAPAAAPAVNPDGSVPAPAQEPLPTGGYIGALPVSPLIGRERELERALQAVAAVTEGGGRLVLCAGEAGVGKTRLVQEVIPALRAQGFVIATGRCYEQQESVPYYPFLDAIEGLYRVCSPTLRAQIPARWPVLEKLLPEAGLPSSAVGGDAPEEQQRLFRAVTGFLAAVAAESPVAVVLDDLHWSDAASIDLLQHICRHTRGDRVLLLATYRDTDLGGRPWFDGMLRDVTREQVLERITVSRLDPSATAALVASALGDRAQHSELAARIYERTEGNPFFVQQMVHDLLERGPTGEERAPGQSGAVGSMEVPEGIRAVIGQRLARLAPATQEVLRTASVLGQTFRFEDLETLAECSEAELERALEEAERSGLVQETGTDRYAFDHALTQAALYVELSGRRRRKLHGAVAEAIEAWPARRRAGATAELAWHYLHAGRPADAFPHVLAVGEGARISFAYADAERQFDLALHVAEESENNAQRREALLQRAQLYRDIYRGRPAVDDCSRALSLARAERDERGELQAVLDLARSYYVLALDGQEADATTQCREQYEAAMRLAERLDDTPTLIQALLETRWLQDFWPEYVPTARANRERALALSLDAGDEELIIRSKLSLIRTRRRSEAESWGEDLETRLTARGDLRKLNELHYHLMWANLQWGSLERCVAQCDAGFAAAARIGVPPVQYGSLKALALAGLGRYGAALAALETEVADDEHPFGRACRDLSLACIQLDLLAYGRAIDTARDVIRQARQVGRAWIEEWAQEVLTKALIHGGRPAEIERELGVAWSDTVAAEVLTARGELEAAEERARAAAEEAWAGERMLEYVTAGELGARILAAQERWDEVETRCAELLGIAGEHGYRPMIWRLEVQRAHALRRLGRGDEAEECRRSAVEVIRELAAATPDTGLRREFMMSDRIRAIVEGV